MSVSMTNFANTLASRLEKVAGAATEKSDPKAKTAFVLEFVDSLIKGDGNSSHAATTVLDIAKNLVNEKLSGEGHQVLRNQIHEELNDRRNTFVSGSKQSLPQQLAKQITPLRNAVEVLEAHALKADSSSAEYGIRDVQNFYFHGLGQIAQTVSKLEGDAEAKSIKSAELIQELAEETSSKYGKELSLEVVTSLKDNIAPVEIYTRQAESKYKLPVLDLENNAESKALVEAFNSGENNLSSKEKNEVVTVATGLLEGKDLMLEYHSLSTKQKAYMEHLRQGADKIRSSSTGLEGIIDKLGSKLPDLLMPAIIGAVLGYLMGGMEVVGGIGAIVVSFIGSDEKILGEAETSKKKTPPKLLEFKDYKDKQGEAVQEKKAA